MHSYNLIDHPWIPVRWLPSTGTSHPSHVSLRDAFTNAHEIADLDAAPHERIALTRLLVCITHAALGAPQDEDHWENFGHDLTTAVPAYLTKAEITEHFHLLGDGPRFLQQKPKSTDPSEGYPLSKIAFHLSSGNNPKLLDHWGEDPRPWTPPSAAIALLCLQNFFVGGSMASKVHGNGPALKSLQMLLLGPNLASTILRNCLDHKFIESTGGKLGRPVWEGTPDHNLLARLAPTPCALWLSDDLQTIFIDQGHQYLEFDAYRDPYASTEIMKDEKRRLIRAKPDQGIWRDLHLLTNLSDASGSSAPLNLQCFNARKELGQTTQLWCGELIKAKDAKIEDCTESTFTVPHGLFCRDGRNLYAAGVEHAEKICNFVYGAVKAYGKTLSNENPPTDEAKKHFWHHLDQHHRILIALAGDPQPGQPAIGAPEASDPWTKLVREAAILAFKAVCPHRTARQLQAYSAGSYVLHKAIYPKPPTTKKTSKTVA
jgi:CRISPR system Cascade subunit CasA